MTQQIERVDAGTPTKIVQTFMAPYIEFSRRYGNKDLTILDCACGNRYQTMILEDRFKTVTSVDKDEKDGVIGFDLGSGPLPFGDKEFDVVFSFETIEHLPEEKHRDFVAELIRVGRLVVIGSISADGLDFVGEHEIFKAANGNNPHHLKEYTRAEWADFFGSYTTQFASLTGDLDIADQLTTYGISNYAVIDTSILELNAITDFKATIITVS